MFLLRSADLEDEMAVRPLVHPSPSLTPAPSKRSSAVPYDFSSPDRIPAGQLHALRPVHDRFAQGFGTNISAYLRTLVSVNVVRVEQLAFAEFSRKIAPPLTLVPLRLHPQDGYAILQLSHEAVFPVLEMLLGGTAGPAQNIDREITEIERCVFEPVLRMLVQELRSAWRFFAAMEFGIQDYGTALAVVPSISSAEPFLAASFELRIGEAVGALSLGLPSRIVRPLLAEVKPRKQPPPGDCSQMLRLLESAQVTADVRLSGAKVLFRDLMSLEPGDILAFDHPIGKELELELNGTPKFKGHAVAVGDKRGFQVKRELRRES